MSDFLHQELVKLAAKELPEDNKDFVVDDYAGGNIDDAYDMGSRAGEVRLARELLEKYY